MTQSSQRTRIFVFSLLLLFSIGSLLGCTQKQESTETTGDTETTETLPPSSSEVDPDVPFVESPQSVVDSMLALADVTEEDVVYDLGSGDGRIVITAAEKFGARGVGIEIRPDLVKKARQNAKEAGVADQVEFRQGDLFEADISDATVVTMYLLPSVNLKVRNKLFQELEPGTRVVSHDFDMDEWEPDSTMKLNGDTIFLWTIPEETPSFVEESKSEGK